MFLGVALFLLPFKAGADVSVVVKDIRVGLALKTLVQDFSVTGEYRVLDAVTGSEVAVARAGERWQARFDGGRIELLRDGESLGRFDNPVVLKESARSILAISAGGSLTGIGPGRPAVEAAGGETGRLDSDLSGYRVLTGDGQSALRGTTGQNLLALSNGGASRKYRGDLEFRAFSDGMAVINQLPLEEYLYGVVPGEMPSSWPEEALKAQAVTARSYAMAQMTAGAYSSYGFDVLAGQQSQVYQGYDAENQKVKDVVDQTRGRVLTCRGIVITAFFHSCSGGYIENSEDVWQNPLEYIKVKPDPADINDKYYHWEKAYDQTQLVDQLRQKGYSFSSISDVVEIARTSSGARVKKVAVTGLDAGGLPARVEICNADSVRSAFGLNSSLFEMEVEKDEQDSLSRIVFCGSGLGHGLGMSQYGALGMAGEGYNYQDILKYYYTDVDIDLLY
ncbi:SpoIID/LytB domain-containing protein [Desulfocucumis palustris]|uniref:SpoIID/LytB domain-containing protein n=1 Tax=Desulfocucumis palustris TaxID=1898651 RepID=UPI0013FDDC62|nr:SpoIID/LytB domain-containing protein [Desulfocucumis palustris]